MRRSRWIAASAIALGLPALLFALVPHSAREDSDSRNRVAARKGNLHVEVRSVGTLDAADAFHAASSLRGDRGKIVRLAHDGEWVAAGDVLIEFDASAIESDIRKLEGELRSREAQVQSAGLSIGIERAQADRALAAQEDELDAARRDESRLRDYIADLEALQARGVGVSSEATQARKKIAQEAARSRKLEMGIARQRSESGHRIAQAEGALARARSELEVTRTSLALARDELARTVIRAPAAGVVVASEGFVGDVRRRMRVGDTAWPNVPILYLPDLSRMVVKARAREEDLHKLRPGLPARVSLEAFPGVTLDGEVTSIGSLLHDPATSGKHFHLLVGLRSTDPRLRPGLTAHVTIRAADVADATLLPVNAVFHDGESPYCYVLGRDGPEMRRLRLGLRGDDHVQVLAGIEPGEQVTLVRP